MRIFTFFFSLLLPLIAFSQGPFLTEIDGKYETLEQRMAYHKVQGSAVAIMRNLEIDTTLYMGYRDEAHQLPVNEETRFQLGSMTGALVNFAVVRLASEGKIDLDAPANDYLTSWKIEEKGFTKGAPITVRDLLLERRGFNPVYKPNGYAPGSDIPTWEQIMAGETPANTDALNLRKSKAKNSSFANDMILQRLLEDVLQQDFATLMQEQVFGPIGMTHTLVAAELSAEQGQTASFGHEENGETIEGGRWIYPELAHSGVWSTPMDFALFVRHIFRAVKGLDNSLISQELALQGVKAQHENAALILLQGENGDSYWGGAPKGFYSQFAANFEQGWIVVGCANRELAWQYVNWDLNGRSIEYAKR